MTEAKQTNEDLHNDELTKLSKDELVDLANNLRAEIAKYEETYLKRQEVADRLNCEVGWVDNAKKDGILKAFKPRATAIDNGKEDRTMVRYRLSDIVKLEQERTG